MANEGNDSSIAKEKEPLVLQSKNGKCVIEDKAHWSNDDKNIFIDIYIK